MPDNKKDRTQLHVAKRMFNTESFFKKLEDVVVNAADIDFGTATSQILGIASVETVEEKTFELILSALGDTCRNILMDGGEHQKMLDAIPNLDIQNEALNAEFNVGWRNIELSIDKSFFMAPHKAPFIRSFVYIYRAWLCKQIGFTDTQSRTLSALLSLRFQYELAKRWSNKPEYYGEFLHESLQEYLSAKKIWHFFKTSFTKKNTDEEYIINDWNVALKEIYPVISPTMLFHEIINYLIEIIRNEPDETIKDELATRLHLFLPALIKRDFLYQFDVNKEHAPFDKGLSVFYVYWTILSHLRAYHIIEETCRSRFVFLLSSLQNLVHGLRINLIGVDLTGADLIGANLRGVNLSGADLSGANLVRANLIRADLRGANLSGANLSQANLSWANLTGANLSGAYLGETNLERVDLSKANLSKANLMEANLCWVQLIEANLKDTNLSRADLKNVYLMNAVLIGTDLSRTDLSWADLSGAKLSGVNLMETNLTRANLSGVDFRESNLMDTNFREAGLTRANLGGVDLWQFDFREAYLDEVDFSGAKLGGVDFREADLRNANFSKAKLRQVDLREADMRGANLSGAKLSYVNLNGVDLTGADLRQINLSDADLSEACVKDANFSGAKLKDVDFRETDLTDAIGLKKT